MAIIGVTYNLKSDWRHNPDDPGDMSAEFDKPETLGHIVTALESGGHRVQKIGNADDLLNQIEHLDVDIVFNVCEGVSGRNRESQVPVFLEMKGIPYVGADGLTLGIALDKVVAKKLFIHEGIPTPRYCEIANSGELEKFHALDPSTRATGYTRGLAQDSARRADNKSVSGAAPEGLHFPLIVKTRHEGSSKGISVNSRVENIGALKRQVKLIHDSYQQPALVEEFIKGTEFTVAVLGNDNPQAMPIVQVSVDGRLDLGDQFYTNALITSERLKYICPAKISDDLAKRIQELAVRVYTCVECRDWGRVDFRVDAQGNPYVLEINPLPSLDVEDVFNVFPNVFGSSYNEIINKVISFALERYGIKEISSISIH